MNDNAIIQLSMMDPKANLDDIRGACAKAKEAKPAALDIPQWFVAFAKEELASSGVAVSTCVGLPGGETSSLAKYAEVKEAIKNGADEIEVPVNMAMVASGDIDNAKNDLNASMAPALGKAMIKAVVEAGNVSDDVFMNAVEMVAAQDVCMIVVSYVTSGKKADADTVAAVKAVAGDKAVAVMGGACVGCAEALAKAGADRVVVSAL